MAPQKDVLESDIITLLNPEPSPEDFGLRGTGITNPEHQEYMVDSDGVPQLEGMVNPGWNPVGLYDHTGERLVTDGNVIVRESEADITDKMPTMSNLKPWQKVAASVAAVAVPMTLASGALAGDYKIFGGVTRSWPGLDSANQDIADINLEIKGVFPGAKDWDDWSDETTGTFSLGVGKKFLFDIPKLGQIETFPTLTYAWASGKISASENGIMSAFGVPGKYAFEQTYDFDRVEAELPVKIFKSKHIDGWAHLFLSYNWHEADTELTSDLGPLGGRQVDGKFSEHGPGIGVGVSVEWKLPYLPETSLMGTFRYDWLTLKGDTSIHDVQKSPFGVQDQRYKQDTEIDFTGPVGGIFLIKYF